MKKLLLSVAALCGFVSAHAQWTTPSGATTTSASADIVRTGNVGIGVISPNVPIAKWDVVEHTGPGSAVNDFRLLQRIGSSGGTGNYIHQNLWGRRDAVGSTWNTFRLRDGISVDVSFGTPTTSRSWWERDAFDNIQSWGDQATTYMTLAQGNLGIGTTTPGSYKLAVEGKVGAREVVVTTAPWADYVFADTYQLRPLSEVEQFIQQNKHLPEVPTAAEVEKNGNSLAETDALLLKKIEELTLYVIELKKENEMQAAKIKALEEQPAPVKN